MEIIEGVLGVMGLCLRVIIRLLLGFGSCTLETRLERMNQGSLRGVALSRPCSMGAIGFFECI